MYIIGGPNGAGKTTAAMTVLPEALGVREFVNADEIARGLSPLNPEGVAIQAGRLMLDRINDLLLKRVDGTFIIMSLYRLPSLRKDSCRSSRKLLILRYGAR